MKNWQAEAKLQAIRAKVVKTALLLSAEWLDNAGECVVTDTSYFDGVVTQLADELRRAPTCEACGQEIPADA